MPFSSRRAAFVLKSPVIRPNFSLLERFFSFFSGTRRTAVIVNTDTGAVLHGINDGTMELLTCIADVFQIFTTNGTSDSFFVCCFLLSIVFV